MEYSLENDFLRVTVSDRGAELRSIRGADGTEYLWQGDARYWAERAPVLFPFTGRVIGKRYEWEGKTYSMGTHGFSRGRDFSVTRKSESEILFMSQEDESTLACYPRRFSFSVEYALTDNTLRVTFTVINRDEKDMLFGLGGHPGFNVPLIKGKFFTDYRLRFPRPCRPKRVILKGAFPTGETEEYPLDENGAVNLNTALFENDGIFLMDHTPEIILETPGDSHRVSVFSEDMPYVGFWKPYNEQADFICIEPWWSLPASYGEKTVLEEQRALIRLAPGKLFTKSFGIRIQ